MKDVRSDLPLAGLDLVLTRPVGAADAMARRWRSEGARCINLPMYSIRVLSASAALTASLRAAMLADALVFASPNAVSACLHHCPDFSPVGRVFAQGPATAKALRRHGIEASAPAQGYTSEDLLADPYFASVAGHRIVRLAGEGGRLLLIETLTRAGALASAIALYRRQPARLDLRHRRALDGLQDPVLVVSSLESLERLPQVLADLGRSDLYASRLLVSSGRLRLRAAALGFARIHEAHSAASADLRAGLEVLAEASRAR
jgi:uroporphyrinogen-III synthase